MANFFYSFFNTVAGFVLAVFTLCQMTEMNARMMIAMPAKAKIHHERLIRCE